MVNNNELKYTSLTNEDIMKQIYDRFLRTSNGEGNSKFDNFRESAIAQTLIEIFAGTVDINNYYIQRRAEECYFDTAQLKSSVISLSRMFGYVMNRKEPSRANIRMIIEGNIEDNQVQIPYYSKFSYDGNPYVLVNTMTYRIPSSIYDIMNDETVITIDTDSFDNPIEIVQGSIKEKVFNGATNAQVNAPFQIYKIEDTDFSNVYGEKDFFFNDVTQVYVGDNKSEDTRFSIDRRSLLNWETISTEDSSTSKNVCVIRTATDGNVEILFGDGENTIDLNGNTTSLGGFARKGAITRKDNIYVQYLACEGQDTNKTGVIGEKVDFSGKIFNSKGDDITSKVSFELLSNVYGGADEESSDSIKYSAPKIFYSLDRLVTKQDYSAYLKSLTSPIDVKNAIAWGEQEERDLAFKFALAKMFNVTLFTVAGSMYDLSKNPRVPKDGVRYNDVVLDLNYNPYRFQTQGYFNIFVIQEMVNQLNRYKIKTSFPAIDGREFTSKQPSSSERLRDIADSIKDSIEANYNNGVAKLNFTYTSSDKNYASNIKATGTVEIDKLNDSSLTNLGGKSYLEKLANMIDTKLVEFKDVRGNRTDNKNFDKEAFIGRGFECDFPNRLFIWETFDDENKCTDDTRNVNGTLYNFRLRFNEGIDSPQSPCYIDSIDDNTFSQILGLSESAYYTVVEDNQNNEMNGKISTIVRDLDSRSQVNIKNIYVSPIIHRFNIVGDVYVKSLYEREDVKNDILNELYEWLDINADFNQPIYLSNIVEIFEKHLGVIHTNIRLEPEFVDSTGQILSMEQSVNNTRNFFYDSSWNNPIYDKYTYRDTVKTYEPDGTGDFSISWEDKNPIADTINNKLIEYLTPNSKNSLANDDWFRSIIVEWSYLSGNAGYHADGRFKGTGTGLKRNSEKMEYETSSYTLLNDVSERSFYTKFVGPLYAEFKRLAESDPDKERRQDYRAFLSLPDENCTDTIRSQVIRDTVINSDFSIIMEDIHSDLIYIIKQNLVDSVGNIDVEYDNDGNFIRGGFTLGSEIVQLLGDAKYKNANGDNVPFLNFRYK